MGIEPPAGAQRGPQPVRVGDDRRAVLGALDRRGLVGDAAAEGPLVIMAIVGAEREIPRIPPVLRQADRQAVAVGVDVDRLQSRPVAPADTAGDRPAIVQALEAGQLDRLRHGHIGVDAVAELADMGITGFMVVDFRAVRQADAGIRRRRQHHTGVVAVVPAIGVDLGIDHIHRPGTELGPCILRRYAGADAEPVIDPVGERRIDVDGDNGALVTVIGTGPATAIVGLQSVRGGDGQTEAQAIGRRGNQIGIGNAGPAAAVAMDRAAVLGAVKTRAYIDGDHPGLNRCAAVQGHAGGVVERGRQVVADDAGTGVGASQRRDALLRQLETGSGGAASRQGQRQCGQGGREGRLVDAQTQNETPRDEMKNDLPWQVVSALWSLHSRPVVAFH